jgi:hypothetical protein
MPDAEGRVSAEVKRRFMSIPDKGHGEQQNAVFFQNAMDFIQKLLRVKYMFEDLSGNRRIKTRVIKGKMMPVIVIVRPFVLAVFLDIDFQPEIFGGRKKVLVRFYPTTDV